MPPITPDSLAAAGWKPRTLPGFMGVAGPLWTHRSDGEGWHYGLLAAPSHLNPGGVVHGGALVTLIDHVISTVAWEAMGRATCLTMQLDTHFLAAVREGDFALARAEVVHKTPGILFLRGVVTVRQAPVLQAQSVMKVIRSNRLSATGD